MDDAHLAPEGKRLTDPNERPSESVAGYKRYVLTEAPDADMAMTVHKEAHGLVADEIYPVVQG